MPRAREAEGATGEKAIADRRSHCTRRRRKSEEAEPKQHGAASGEDPICLPRAGLVALGAPWLPRAAIGLSWKAIWLPGG